MAYDLRPDTTRARAAYVVGTAGYTLPVTSYSDGRDVSVQRDRAGVLRNIVPVEAGVEALSGGGVRITLTDLTLWQAGDTLQVTRSSAVDDPSAYPRTGAASSLSVRASMERIFALLQEILADAVGGESPVSQVQLENAVSAALAARTPQFTQALLSRLEGTMSRDAIANAIDAALDDLPGAVRTNVTGSFVINVLDTAIGSTIWRQAPVADVTVDPNQMTGTGSEDSPITILTDGITVGLLAANAVQSRNIGDEQVTIDKLAATLQANWQNMLLSARNITVSAGTATVTRVDGSTYTFDVGTGGVGGNLEVYDVDPQGRPRSRGTFGQILFRDMTATVSGASPNQRLDLDPVFPPQVPADWDATSGPARVLNKPEHIVRTFTDRPMETDPDEVYAYAGEPDGLGGPGLYQSYANPDLPLNLVSGQFTQSDDGRRNALTGLPTSLSNRYLRGFGMNIGQASNPIYLWLDDSAPAAATLYAQFRTANVTRQQISEGQSLQWSVWSTVLTFTPNTDAVVPLVAPSGSRQYRASPGVFLSNWQNGHGRDVQVRVWTDALATAPYNLKRANLERWLENPEVAKSYLEHVDPDHRLSTHFLKDGAVARVVDSDPTDLSGYVAGEMVVVLTAPPSLKVVTGGTDTPVANANRMTVSTDGQGNAVSAQGDFDPNPGTRLYLFHAAPGGGTGAAPGKVTLYLDPPGTPPATIVARPVTGGFPQLTFTRIQGAVGTYPVGARTFYGYEASFVDANLHRFADATFSYDLYSEWNDATDNVVLNLDTRTTHQPLVLSDIGAGSSAAVPMGGWTLGQVAPENRQAGNITVDTSSFAGDLGSGDTTVQAALETLDGGAVGPPVRYETSGLKADDDGGILSWSHATTTWVLRQLVDSPLFAWTRNAAQWTLGVAGKLAEIVNAFDGGSWAAVAGSAADVPFVSTTPLVNPPVGVPSAIQFALAVADVSPAWPRTEGGQTWVVVRMPIAVDFQRERYRLEQVDAEGSLNESVQLDHSSVRVVGRAAPYDYYAVPLTRIGADEDYRMAVLTPFEPVRSRLNLVTRMLADFVPDAMKTEANDRRTVVWSWAVRGFRLGSPERPVPVSVLPAQLVPGRRYITLADLVFQPWFNVTLASTGVNTPQDSGQFGDANEWRLVRFSNAQSIDQRVRGQLVLRRTAGTELHPIRIYIDGRPYDLNDTTHNSSNDFVVSGPPASILGARRIYIRQDGDAAHNAPAAVDYPSGDWTAQDPQTLVATPGSAATWAQAGEPRPRLAEQVLVDATGDGLSVTNSSASFNGSFEALQLNGVDYDLDDDDKQLGVVFVTGTARLHSKSDASISFDRTAVVNEIQFQGFTGLNDVRQEGVYSRSDVEGVLVASLPVWLSGSTISTERYYLTRNGANVLGRFKRQEGSTGSSSWSVSFRELVVVVANDGTPAGSLTFTGLQQTPPTIEAGEYYRGNATGTALEQSPLPVAGEAVAGIVELANDAEADAGTDSERAMTPEQTKRRIDAIPRATGTVVGLTRLSTLAEAQGFSNFETAISPLRLRQVLRGSVSEASETYQGTVEFASQSESDAGTSTDRAMTPLRVKERVDAATPDASQTQKGVVELAGNPEVDAGSDNTKAVTPRGLLRAFNRRVATTTQLGTARLATDAAATAGTDTGASFLSPKQVKDRIDAIPSVEDASTSEKGIIQLATEAEADAGTNDGKAITPELLHRVVDAEIAAHIHRASELEVAISSTVTLASSGADRVLTSAEIDDNAGFAFTGGSATRMTQSNPYVVSFPSDRILQLTSIRNSSQGWVRIITSARLTSRGRSWSNPNHVILLGPSNQPPDQDHARLVFARSANNMSSVVNEADMDEALGNASETGVGLIELATAAEATTGTDASRAMTPVRVAERIAAIPDASDSVKGLIELATAAEVEAGTDTTRAVTPAGLEAKLPHKVEVLTEAAYNALVTKDADTIYFRTA